MKLFIIVTQLVMHFMEPGLLPCSQESEIEPYHKPVE